jgi:hypothetical protein
MNAYITSYKPNSFVLAYVLRQDAVLKSLSQQHPAHHATPPSHRQDY